MAPATGDITVETEIDLDMHENEIDIEFDSLEDVIETAELNNYTKEEIIDWCFDHGVDITTYLLTALSTAQIIDLYTQAITEKLDEYQLTVSNQRDRINELEAQLAEARKTDEEAVKEVAY